MSVLRNHRIIIACAFLPTTNVLHESTLPNGAPLAASLNPQTPLDDERQGPPLRRTLSRSTNRSRYPTFTPATFSNGHGLHFAHNSSCHRLKIAVESVNDRINRKIWVGTLGSSTDSFSSDFKADIDRKMWNTNSSVPVWIPDAEFENYYDEFCHQVLWPCLHYVIPDAPKTKLFLETTSFKQYVAVNKRFAEAIEAVWTEGDVVWINDYHLMLVPLLLRNSTRVPALARAPIGFFMHVAFPSSEIFRCLSVREQLLRGVLGADLVGFQTESYARNFRYTVARILSVEALPKGIQVESGTTGAHEGRGWFVEVGTFPIGIDVNALRELRRDRGVSECVRFLRQHYAGMQIIVGRDKVDDIQGLRHKFEAFERFLKEYPSYQGKVILVQLGLQTTQLSAGGVLDAVARINSAFGTPTYQPIVFVTQEVCYNEYLALLTVADAFLVTSLREGMALRAYEFVECQEGRHRPLILSEFVGSYSYRGFQSCIAVHPYDKRRTADAIYQALTMDDDEALSRWQKLHNHITTQTAQAFVTSFLTRCIGANVEHTATINDDVPAFDAVQLLPQYKDSQKRLILLDFEGTLWYQDLSHEGLLATFMPPRDVVDLLNKLAEDRRNKVWLLSGLPISSLKKIENKVPKIGIVAENGCYIKHPRQRRWISMMPNLDLKWKESCVEMLNYFTERTPGSFIEEREASVVWRFWTGVADASSDRQWAKRQAAEAQNHVYDSERYDLHIIPGANSFLVLPSHISRSTAVNRILNPRRPTQSPSSSSSAPDPDVYFQKNAGDKNDMFTFVLAVSGDEGLLRALNNLDNDCVMTVSTSGKGTDAKWKSNDVGDVGKEMGVFANVCLEDTMKHS